MTISNSFKALLLCGTVLFGMAQAMAQAPVAPDPTAPPAAAPADQSGIVQVAANKSLRDGTFVGRGFDAYWGIVQVQANVQGGRLVSVDTLKSPNHNRTSKSINRAALPPLQQEAVRNQSARVHVISGATLTSRAYAASLNNALKQASN
jgi:uncharacterized protein with FMN-binding domain